MRTDLSAANFLFNDPPVAQDGSASGNEDTAINGTLVATDTDSPSLSFQPAPLSARAQVRSLRECFFSPGQDRRPGTVNRERLSQLPSRVGW